MAKSAVEQRGITVKLACEAFRISQDCYRCVAKGDSQNDLIAQWLVALTDNNRNWGFGLCFLYLCSRRLKTEPPCRLKTEPGAEADSEMVGCG